MLYEHDSTKLFESALTTIHDFRCTATETNTPVCEESMPVPVLCFPRRGVFYREERGKQVLGDANQVHFFNPGVRFAISYPLPGGDESTMFHLSAPVLREIAETVDPAAAEVEEPRFRFPTHASDPAIYLVQSALFDYLSGNPAPDPLAVEESATHLVGAAVTSAYMRGNTTARGGREATVRAHRELTETTKSILAIRFEQPLSLGEVSRQAASSPYHLSRVFKSVTGITVHSYLTRLRLRASLHRMTDRSERLADLALQLGFSSHAHFTGAFRREFGVPPSEVRKSPTMRRILGFLRALEV